MKHEDAAQSHSYSRRYKWRQGGNNFYPLDWQILKSVITPKFEVMGKRKLIYTDGKAVAQ